MSCAEKQLEYFFLTVVRFLFRHGCTESDRTPSVKTQPNAVCLVCDFSMMTCGSAIDSLLVVFLHLLGYVHLFLCHVLGILSVLN